MAVLLSLPINVKHTPWNGKKAPTCRDIPISAAGVQIKKKQGETLLF
jgi:hypothetical protein